MDTPTDAYTRGYRFGRFEDPAPTNNMPWPPGDIRADPAAWDDWESGYSDGYADRPKF